MRVTYRAGGKINPSPFPRIFNPQTLLVLTLFLPFIQLGLRTRPSCQTWTPWPRSRSPRGSWRPSSTAAWSLPRSEPRWGCRGRPATCVAWPRSVPALSPTTPSCWPTLPPRSRGTTRSCRHLHLHHHLPLTETVVTCSSIPAPFFNSISL